MKRYLLFVADKFYPCGGWLDFQNESDNLEELKSYELDSKQEMHIIDTTTKSMVFQKYSKDY
jgi:hypothetical protein